MSLCKILEDELKIQKIEISKNNKENHMDKLEEYIEKVYPSDESVNNGSSIALLIEFDERKLLLLGDAHPDIIHNNLMELGEVNFDLVKVSHHGSFKNTTSELAKFLTSTRYLFSTNGSKCCLLIKIDNL